MLRLLKPAVMPEASTRVKLGHPDELPPGTERHFPKQNLSVFSERQSVYAISAICPHLGCIVHRLPEGRYECPCHGSKFNARGEVFSGPSPSGLPWIEVQRAPNGVLYANTSVVVPAGTVWTRG
jgi:Rieske Fe-S protein